MPIEEQIFEKISEIQALRNLPILVIDTDNERGLTREIYSEIYDKLKELQPVEELDVILESFGGSIDSAYKTAKLIRNYARTINVLVPHYAKSAATLICLASDKIILPPKAELGPLDAQVPDPRDRRNRISALDTFKSLEFIRAYAIETMDITVRLLLERGLTIDEATEKSIQMVDKVCNPLMRQIDPMSMGEYERILAIAENYGFRLLRHKMTPENANKLLDRIIRRYPSHTFVIDLEELTDLGLPCEQADMDLRHILEELDDLFGLIDNPFIELVSHVGGAEE